MRGEGHPHPPGGCAGCRVGLSPDPYLLNEAHGLQDPVFSRAASTPGSAGSPGLFVHICADVFLEASTVGQRPPWVFPRQEAVWLQGNICLDRMGWPFCHSVPWGPRCFSASPQQVAPWLTVTCTQPQHLGLSPLAIGPPGGELEALKTRLPPRIF